MRCGAAWCATMCLRELTYTNREFSGAQAHEYGFATFVDANPLARAKAIAAEIANRNPHAERAAKRLFNSLPPRLGRRDPDGGKRRTAGPDRHQEPDRGGDEPDGEAQRAVRRSVSGPSIRRRAVIGLLASLPFAPAARAINGPVTVFEARRIVTMESAQPHARFAAVAGAV